VTTRAPDFMLRKLTLKNDSGKWDVCQLVIPAQLLVQFTEDIAQIASDQQQPTIEFGASDLPATRALYPALFAYDPSQNDLIGHGESLRISC
jgi:hypothetical protein